MYLDVFIDTPNIYGFPSPNQSAFAQMLRQKITNEVLKKNVNLLQGFLLQKWGENINISEQALVIRIYCSSEICWLCSPEWMCLIVAFGYFAFSLMADFFMNEPSVFIEDFCVQFVSTFLLRNLC